MDNNYEIWAQATLRWLSESQKEQMKGTLAAWKLLWKGLLEAEMKGSVCVRRDGLLSDQNEQEFEKEQEPKEMSEDEWDKAIEVWKKELHLMGAEDQTETMLVDDGQRYYMRAHYKDEAELAKRIAELALTTDGVKPQSVNEAWYKDLKEKHLVQFVPNDRQIAAINKALDKRFCVVSGGPGTGKTTTVLLMLRELMEEAQKQGKPIKRVGLAAPTGKATVRVRESVTKDLKSEYFAKINDLYQNGHLVAQTLHRWLVTPTSTNEKPTPQNPLELDVLIIDEASMIDAHLAKKVFDVIDSKRTRVVLLGDKHQLAAVNPGSVFAAMNEALSDYSTELTTSNRFKAGSIIDKLAKAIIKETKTEMTGDSCEKTKQEEEKFADVKALLQADEATQQKFVQAEYYSVKWDNLTVVPDNAVPEAAQNLIERQDILVPPSAQSALLPCLDRYIRALECYLLGESIQDPAVQAPHGLPHMNVFAVLNSFKVLCAERQNKYSVAALNAWASAYVKKALKAFLVEQKVDEATITKLFMDEMAWLGLPIIVRKNDRELNVYNGDLAIVLPPVGVLKNPSQDWSFKAYLEANKGDTVAKAINTILLPRYDQAFAITIHQSQGSEYPEVYIFLPESDTSQLATRELLYTAITRTQGKVFLYGSDAVLETSVSTPTQRTSGLADRLKTQLAT